MNNDLGLVNAGNVAFTKPELKLMYMPGFPSINHLN